MRIGSTKFRQSLLLFLCFLGLSLLVTACSSSSDELCVPGTRKSMASAFPCTG